jgi:hypothetical protein
MINILCLELSLLCPKLNGSATQLSVTYFLEKRIDLHTTIKTTFHCLYVCMPKWQLWFSNSSVICFMFLKHSMLSCIISPYLSPPPPLPSSPSQEMDIDISRYTNTALNDRDSFHNSIRTGVTLYVQFCFAGSDKATALLGMFFTKISTSI